MSKKNAEVIFGDYAVGIIDVLNQRDKLRQWTRPRDADELSRLVGLLKETWGPVTQFREVARKILEDTAERMTGPIHEQLLPLYRQLTDEQKSQLQQVRQAEYGIMHYSDTILLHSRLFNLNNVPQLSGLHLFISALGGLMLASLAGRIAIRGAIEVGLAGPLPEGDIYGPAIVLAHDLEAKIAQYPRIVIGRQVMEFLDFVQKKADEQYCDQFAKSIAAECRKLICPDPVDGWPIVDYLGPGFVELGRGSVAQDAIEQALRFAEGQYQAFSKANDVKLAPRYERLISYLEAGRKNWNQGEGNQAT